MPPSGKGRCDLIDMLTIKRRSFLTGSAGAVVAASSGVLAEAKETKVLPDYVAWKDANALIVHSDKTMETKRSEFGTSVITPEEKLYIRNNVNTPPESILADRDGWKVEISGVKEPRTLTVAELKSLGLVTAATVLQCSGNGRKYFKDQLTGNQKMSGTPWTVGAAGCVIWSGVPLRAVVDALGGPADGARFITGTGGEELPAGLDPKLLVVERSVPIANLDNVILAWEMNGRPLSLAHGGPLRMVVPGYSGVNNIKYVKTVALTEAESDAKIQKSSYRFHALGEKGSPDHPSVWEQPVKSWITTADETAKAGPVQIAGVAFGGMNACKSVEVSLDGGQTWQEAEFVGPDLGRFAWRVFLLAADLAPGTYTLVSRATDTEGNVQPEESEMNGAGYGHNGWRAPAVTLTVA
ncbi:molybdopterin-dependent oxidoreductase [Sinorhizobium medicae]|nr:oxidoreductase molybdopterin binding [Sinorhizobium medicae WSM419]MDX0405284.1 molybdopterin-dependent oxidoreductase [Sinorhizobium medicae]MDX0410732.1 molybdopterin-dependent oxidoreductase [Sinorhizobium medicae]MDX0417158.1 molybdopterin-dependent oxidoreductase [Sinorhizobium medicae]MDX0423852.1 molybdopterin-dependent oxidoreductase [Sinorhizobium medicae]